MATTLKLPRRLCHMPTCPLMRKCWCVLFRAVYSCSFIVCWFLLTVTASRSLTVTASRSLTVTASRSLQSSRLQTSLALCLSISVGMFESCVCVRVFVCVRACVLCMCVCGGGGWCACVFRLQETPTSRTTCSGRRKAREVPRLAIMPLGLCLSLGMSDSLSPFDVLCVFSGLGGGGGEEEKENLTGIYTRSRRFL